MKLSLGTALAAAALSLAVAAPAAAKTIYTSKGASTATSFVDIDLTGWQSFGGFGRPANSEAFLDLGAGTVVTGFEYIGLSFNTEGGSWLEDLVLSVNNSDASGYLDWSPSTVQSSGSFGPEGGAWGGATGVGGPFGAGGEFSLLEDGVLWVTVYDGFDDPFGDTGLVLDTTVTAGTLRVYVSAVPEPGTYGMMALGLLAVGAVMRKRQQR